MSKEMGARMKSSKAGTRTARLLFALALVGALAAGACGGKGPGQSQSEGRRRYHLKGKVVQVDKAQQHLVIDHEEIPGFMGAMTMPYPVADAATLDRVSPGDQVTADVVVDQNGNIVPLANVVTSSGNCKLGTNFNSGGTLYKLLMSPFPFSGAGDGTPTCPPTGCPATGFATVTCNKVSNSQCVSWTIMPYTNAPNANGANLYSYTGTRKGPWVFIGQYYNTYRIDVTNP